jgi:hypothetical protein
MRACFRPVYHYTVVRDLREHYTEVREQEQQWQWRRSNNLRKGLLQRLVVLRDK